jgi:broad specificity phosphatase PhoE
MGARFLLIRHGESEWNAQGRWQGRGDPPLSDRGREHARSAAEQLKGFVGSVVSSPLRRAHETAKIIASGLGLGPISIVTDLQEVDTGAWSGLTSEEIAERFPDEWLALREGRHEGWPGGETREAFRRRVIRALEELARARPDGETLVVTHGGPIAVLERELGIHPGFGAGNLVGRWFEFLPLRAISERIAFVS